MKKESVTVALFCFFALGFFAYKSFFNNNHIEIPKYGNYLSCIGIPYDLKVSLNGEYILPAKGIPDAQDLKDRLFYSTAITQNLYSFTNLVDQNPNTSLKWSSFGHILPKIKITNVEETRYPIDIEFSYTSDNLIGFPPIAKDYLLKLLPYKHIKAGEIAFKVKYELESEILTCFTKPDPKSFESLEIYRPIDPYLAYFFLPESHRVLVKNPSRKAEGIYNPCMNPDSITASGNNPFGFWYFWRPKAKGHGANKTPFDCSLFYKEGRTIEKAQVSITQVTPKKVDFFSFNKFENLERPIRFSILVGGFEGEIFERFDPEEVKKYVELYMGDGTDIQTARKELPSKYDLHFEKVLILLWKIRNHIQIHSHTIEADELSVRVTLKGKLKLSRKDIELNISMAPNHPKFPGADKFAHFFSKDFLKSDIFVYEGHAAAGDVFTPGLKKLTENLEVAQNKKIKYQIFALYSCSSTFYYDPEKFPRVNNPEFQRDILRTAGAYADGAGNGSLAMIASLDQFLYNESYVPFAFWAKNFKSDNFYILSNH